MSNSRNADVLKKLKQLAKAEKNSADAKQLALELELSTQHVDPIIDTLFALAKSEKNSKEAHAAVKELALILFQTNKDDIKNKFIDELLTLSSNNATIKKALARRKSVTNADDFNQLEENLADGNKGRINGVLESYGADPNQITSMNEKIMLEAIIYTAARAITSGSPETNSEDALEPNFTNFINDNPDLFTAVENICKAKGLETVSSNDINSTAYEVIHDIRNKRGITPTFIIKKGEYSLNSTFIDALKAENSRSSSLTTTTDTESVDSSSSSYDENILNDDNAITSTETVEESLADNAIFPAVDIDTAKKLLFKDDSPTLTIDIDPAKAKKALADTLSTNLTDINKPKTERMSQVELLNKYFNFESDLPQFKTREELKTAPQPDPNYEFSRGGLCFVKAGNKEIALPKQDIFKDFHDQGINDDQLIAYSLLLILQGSGANITHGGSVLTMINDDLMFFGNRGKTSAIVEIKRNAANQPAIIVGVIQEGLLHSAKVLSNYELKELSESPIKGTTTQFYQIERSASNADDPFVITPYISKAKFTISDSENWNELQIGLAKQTINNLVGEHGKVEYIAHTEQQKQLVENLKKKIANHVPKEEPPKKVRTPKGSNSPRPVAKVTAPEPSFVQRHPVLTGLIIGGAFLVAAAIGVGIAVATVGIGLVAAGIAAGLAYIGIHIAVTSASAGIVAAVLSAPVAAAVAVSTTVYSMTYGATSLVKFLWNKVTGTKNASPANQDAHKNGSTVIINKSPIGKPSEKSSVRPAKSTAGYSLIVEEETLADKVINAFDYKRNPKTKNRELEDAKVKIATTFKKEVAELADVRPQEKLIDQIEENLKIAEFAYDQKRTYSESIYLGESYDSNGSSTSEQVHIAGGYTEQKHKMDDTPEFTKMCDNVKQILSNERKLLAEQQTRQSAEEDEKNNLRPTGRRK